MQIAIRLGDYLWRPLTDSEADTDFVLDIRNSAAAQAAFFTPRITREDHLRFLRLAEERGEINWLVEHHGRRVGSGGIYRIDRKNKRAETGRLIALDPQVHLRTAYVALYVAFEVLELNKLAADALVTNEASNRAGERMGFDREGVLREHVFKDGVARDIVLFGALRRDWPEHRAALVAQYGEPQVARHMAAAW